MKARADRRALADAITRVSAAIPTRPQVSILAAVEIKAEGSTLTLRATDFTQTLWHTVDAEIADEGAVHVSGHRLRAVVASLSGVDADLSTDDSSLVVASGRSTYRAQLMNPDHFPARPVLPDVRGEADAGDLTEALRRIHHASGGDDLTTVAGIVLDAKSGELRIAGTDRFAIGSVRVPYSGEDFTARLYHQHATSALKGLDGPVGLRCSVDAVAVEGSRGGAQVSLLAGEYPNIERLVERGFGETFRADRGGLAAALGRTALTLERNGSVWITLGDGTASLRGRDDGAELFDEIEIQGSIHDRTLLVNPDYLKSLLDAIPEPEVEVATPLRDAGPMQVTGIDGDSRSDDLHVLMTMRNPKESR